MAQESRPPNGKSRESGSIGVGIALGFLFGLMLGNLAMGLTLGILGGSMSDLIRERKDKAGKD